MKIIVNSGPAKNFHVPKDTVYVTPMYAYPDDEFAGYVAWSETSAMVRMPRNWIFADCSERC